VCERHWRGSACATEHMSRCSYVYGDEHGRVPVTFIEPSLERPHLIDAPHCDSPCVHEDAVEAALEGRADVDEVTYLADTFQMLASPTRLRIVEALALRELCVCDLAAVVGVSQSAVSHQLRQMRQMRIVQYRKEGRMAYYRLDDPHVETLFGTGLEHVREGSRGQATHA